MGSLSSPSPLPFCWWLPQRARLQHFARPGCTRCARCGHSGTALSIFWPPVRLENEALRRPFNKEAEMLEESRRIAPLAVLVLSLGAGIGATAPPAGSAPPASAALERFKALAGDWVAAEDGDMVKKGDLVARYAVTAGGSAVVETVFPGRAHEMVTVY